MLEEKHTLNIGGVKKLVDKIESWEYNLDSKNSAAIYTGYLDNKDIKIKLIDSSQEFSVQISYKGVYIDYFHGSTNEKDIKDIYYKISNKIHGEGKKRLEQLAAE